MSLARPWRLSPLLVLSLLPLACGGPLEDDLSTDEDVADGTQTAELSTFVVDGDVAFGGSQSFTVSAGDREGVFAFETVAASSFNAKLQSVPSGDVMRLALYQEAKGKWRRVARVDGANATVVFDAPKAGKYLLVARFKGASKQGTAKVWLSCTAGACGNSCPVFSPPNCPGRIKGNGVGPDGCQLPPTCENDCGGLLGLSCAADAYCDFADDSCGAADQLGTCKFRPQACPEIYAPVCGCDGKTYYSAACSAAGAGVDIVSTGECPAPTPPMCPEIDIPECTGGNIVYSTLPDGCSIAECSMSCGSRGLSNCTDGYVCIYPESANCGRADAPGVCTPPANPAVTSCITVYDPVCGCDGKTYSNSCFAGLANASIDHDGPCAP